jgi:DNA-binding response OmpR family regulator
MTRILVADDSETILLLFRKRLEHAGYDVITATNGEEALAALAAAGPTGRPDLVLLDAMMPAKSGLEALAELRGSGDRTPVVIVSAHPGTDAERAQELGADGYVAKPIDWDDLLARIRDLTAAA